MTRKTPAQPVLKFARDLGCDTAYSRGAGHWKITYQGRYVGTVASTPSDPRSMLNARSLIRRNVNRIKEQA